MSASRPADRPPGPWQPPGRRWGRGVRSLLPYLNHAVQAKLLALEVAAEDREPVRNPVFREMQIKIRM